MKHKISIFIITYNEAHIIAKCLEKLKTCPECDVNITGKLLNHAILEIINPNPLEWNDGTIYFDRYKKICFLEAGSYGSVYVFKDMQKDKM